MFFSHDRAGGMRFFGCCMAAAGLLALGFALVEVRRDIELRARGREVTARVLGRDTDSEDSDGNRRTRYFLQTRYPVGGSWAEQRFGVSRSVYEEYPFGSQVRVIYDPMNPTSARLAADLRAGTSSLLPGGFAVVLLLTGAGFLIAANQVKKREAEEEDVPDLEEALARARRS